MSGVSEALKPVLDGASPESCIPLAEALGVGCAAPGGTPSAEECEGCVAAMASALECRDGESARARVEAARIAGWLQGFAPVVWLLPSLADGSGMHLVDEESCAEYERRVSRLVELLEEWR